MPNQPSPDTPDRREQREQELHAALLAGRRAATHDLTHYFHAPLLARLEREFPGLRGDPDLDGCLLRALLAYYREPERYQPQKGSLWNYLYQAAYRDTANHLKKRHRQLELPLETELVAEAGTTRNIDVESKALGLVPGLPDGVELTDLLSRLRASLNPEDHPIIELVLAERAPFEAFVRALALDGLPPAEQQQRVKLARDRVHAARRRLRKRYQDG